MKISKVAMVCGVAFMGLSAQSMAEISMNIGATSNYVWRGATQTSDESAVSGGLDWSSDVGIYAGTWISNVTGGYELDLYGGYAGNAGDFGYDAGFIYYGYDDDADANFLELAASGSWKLLSAGVNYTLSADNDDSEGDLYYYAGLNLDLPEDFSLGATIGTYDYDVGDDYSHLQIDLTKSAGDFGDVTLSLSDTDKDVGADEDIRFFVSWGKSF